CNSVSVANGGTPSCTITNENFDVVQVKKIFSDSSTASVTVSMNCTDGTVSYPDGTSVSPAANINIKVSEFDFGTTCTVVENPVPSGYSVSYTNCSNIAVNAGFIPTSDGGATIQGVPPTPLCTVTNTVHTEDIIVHKLFNDASTSPVLVTITCSNSGIVKTPPS